MKIAFYISDMDKGGAQRVVITLMESLLKDGDEVLLITTRKGQREYAVPEGIRRVFVEVPDDRIGKSDILSRIGNFRMRVSLLRKVLKEEKPDSTVAFIGKMNMMLLLASRGLPGKYFVSVRATPSEEYYTPLLKFIARTLFKRADAVILQTYPSMSFFPKGIRKKAVVLPNPLNTQFICPIYEGERTKRIVAVGRVDGNKNHRLIMEAYEKMLERHPELSDYELMVFGDGELRETLVKEAEKAELGKISFPGLITDVAGTIKDASLYILSSDTEGMPNALMEAMALGLPVISTDCPCGGPNALIEDGVNGRLVPVRDAEKMSIAMAEVLSDPEKAKEMGRKAAEIQVTCAPDTVAQKWRDVICAE